VLVCPQFEIGEGWPAGGVSGPAFAFSLLKGGPFTMGRVAIFLSTWVLALISNIDVCARDSGAPQTSPKPYVLVSLERQSIRENDVLRVEVWFVNDGPQDLEDARLHVTAPDFLEWRSDSCGGSQFLTDLDLGQIRSRSTLVRHLCVTSKSDVVVGTFNILFAFEYRWQVGKQSSQSVVATEKPLQVNLLGTDTFAGIPLGLAGLVLPGLLFWIVVDKWNVPWGVDLALGEKIIYSVLVSSLILVLMSKTNYVHAGASISLTKLFVLAVIGFGTGFIVGGIDFFTRLVYQRREENRTVRLGDDQLISLGKLLRGFPKSNLPRTIVRLKSGNVFLGSLGDDRSGFTSLVGWYEIDWHGQPNEIVEEMRRLESNRDLVALFESAQKRGLPINLQDAVKKLQDGELATTGDGLRVWRSEDVIDIQRTLDAGTAVPLKLA
jgi:hypothetical protein